MPPKTLSATIKKATVIIGVGAGVQNQELAAFAAEVIARWAAIEVLQAEILAVALGASAGPAVAMFSALRSDRAQSDAVGAAMRHSLDERAITIYQAILNTLNKHHDRRNELAHWVWAHCPELPDAILVCKPAEVVKLTMDDETYFREFFANGKKGPGPAQPIGIDPNKVKVYTKPDFLELNVGLMSVSGHLFAFKTLVTPRLPATLRDGQYRLLENALGIPEGEEPKRGEVRKGSKPPPLSPPADPTDSR